MQNKSPSLLDPAFVYVPSVETDIRKTFERIRRMQNNDAGNGVRTIGPTQQGITASGCPVGTKPTGLANLEIGSQSGPASPHSPFARKEGK